MGSTNNDSKTRDIVKASIDMAEKNSENKLQLEDSMDNNSEKTPMAQAAAKPPRPTPKVDIVGANARVRNPSESSSDSPKSPFVANTKKQRVTPGSSPIQNFIFPGVAASPPKFLSLEEVMKAANGVSNMVLAHEIAVDRDFKLEKFEPPANSFEKRVRDTMHRAFWDNMREQLDQDPRVYTQTFILLKEVQDNLLEITLPHHTRLRQEIKDRMDVDLIKQQAEHDVLNFQEYSHYVLSVMGNLCAPVRDEAIQKLMMMTDPVEVFKGVMELLDMMRLDMANFTIQQIRPQVIAQSVEYERSKFSEFLDTQNDGLEITREWLVKQVTPQDLEGQDETALKATISKVMSRSFLYLLSWPENKLLPETIVLDGSRFLELGDRLKQVCIIGSVLLVTMSTLSSKLPNADVLKRKLKKNICLILDDGSTESETYKLIDNVAEQVIADVSDHLKEHNLPALTQPAVTALKAQLIETKNPEQRIRQLITLRAEEFIISLLSSTTGHRLQLPLGLSSLQEELAHVCGNLLRIVSHNREVFGSYYSDILTKHIKGAHKSPPTRDLAAELDLD